MTKKQPKQPKPRPFAVVQGTVVRLVTAPVGFNLNVDASPRRLADALNAAAEAWLAERCAECTLKKIAARASFDKFVQVREDAIDSRIARGRLAKLKKHPELLVPAKSTGLGDFDEDEQVTTSPCCKGCRYLFRIQSLPTCTRPGSEICTADDGGRGSLWKPKRGAKPKAKRAKP